MTAVVSHCYPPEQQLYCYKTMRGRHSSAWQQSPQIDYRPMVPKAKHRITSRMGYDTMSSWYKTFNDGIQRRTSTDPIEPPDDHQIGAVEPRHEHKSPSRNKRSPVTAIPIELPTAVPSFHDATSSWSPPPSPGALSRSGTACSSTSTSSPRSPRADPVRAPESPTLSMSAREKRKLGEKLYSAACAGDLDHIRLLLHIGAPIDSGTMVEGLYEAFKPAKPGVLSPLAGAAGHGQLDAAELLLMHGASLDPSINQSSSSPLHAAIRADDVEIARFFLELGADVNGLNCYKTSPLMAAVKYASIDMVKLILEYRPDQSQMSFIGAAAIHWAVWPDRPEILELLLKAGADKNHAMGNGSTPLHCAASGGHLATTAMLLKYGADVNKRDDEWKTPLDLAEGAGHDDIARLLQEAHRRRATV